MSETIKAIQKYINSMPCTCDQDVGHTCISCNLDINLFEIMVRQKELQAQIKSLSEQLEKAEECLRFYADKNKYSFSTDIDDFIEWYGGDEDNYKIAGYKAREYFKQKGEQK